VTDAILVIVSCREDEAQSIAQPLIEEKLAACISIIPAVKSMYVWQGKFCQEQESLLLIKTSRAYWADLEKRIKVLHSYTVPEILAIPIEAGHKPYLDWIQQMVGKKLEDHSLKKI
jgi:periplasmic divalent cation tolerance protein